MKNNVLAKYLKWFPGMKLIFQLSMQEVSLPVILILIYYNNMIFNAAYQDYQKAAFKKVENLWFFYQSLMIWNIHGKIH